MGKSGFLTASMYRNRLLLPGPTLTVLCPYKFLKDSTKVSTFSSWLLKNNVIIFIVIGCCVN